MLRIAAGIVLGGLVLAFLLRTRAGWYVLVGTPAAAIVGLLAAMAAWSVLLDGYTHSDAEKLGYILGVPLLALCAGWWVPRTISYYQSHTAEARKQEVFITRGRALRWAAYESWQELWTGIVGIVFLLALLVAPFAWAFGSARIAGVAKIACVIAWGLVSLMAGAFALGRYRDRAVLVRELREGAKRRDA